jgi:hypothetical protein
MVHWVGTVKCVKGYSKFLLRSALLQPTIISLQSYQW